MSEIDVSKCKHYKNRNCVADYLVTNTQFSEAKCELIKDCYFKQLQQLKQENEELKKSLNYEEKINVKIAQESVDVNDRLKAKLKKIKEICNRYKTCNVIHKDYILEIIEE